LGEKEGDRPIYSLHDKVSLKEGYDRNLTNRGQLVRERGRRMPMKGRIHQGGEKFRL